MKTHNKFNRVIATFFLLIFFPTLVPENLYANNNGPVAPEATSFEPVDATDMVNLATGDMSYVLPLLNVPSPEGGYPLALSYHAGIAMDQEASWVGLGWTLNPGAINRSVRGVPDDWGKSRISELVYDRGQSLDYYNFSIGGTIPYGITIGMSRSWGAHQAWGGTVGYAGMSVTADTDGYVGVGMGAGGFSLYMDSEGNGSLGIGGSYTNKAGNGFGGSLTYDLDKNKISGGSIMAYNKPTELKQNCMGFSFSSNSIGITNNSLKGGGGLNSSQTAISSNEYYDHVSNKGFNFNVGLYWVSYQHTNRTYSLFKLYNTYVSGTLNLYDSKKENAFLQNGQNYMDVKNYLPNGSDYTDVPRFPDYGYSQIISPNYDSYSIAAQGIMGSFSPKIFDEIPLYAKVSEGVNAYYLTTPPSYNDSYYKLNNKIFFYFDNVNSSFLRTKKGTFKSLDSAINLTAHNADYHLDTNEYMPAGNEGNLMNNIITDDDNTFSSPYDNNGNLTKVNERKRDGNFIEAFTNTEIVNGQTNGSFLEVPGYDRNSYNTMAPNGIGAYRVTGLDGKVYHYSLPVYNFEEIFKNYKNPNDENEKFYESVKKSPYATHWLLTAITGPDYVDTNNNNVTDEGDYGYWVQFDYGKWSEGYAWRSPKVGGKPNYDGNYIKSYSCYWGRKEIYYLDKIKTRTHTALFLKSLRNDDKSTAIQKRIGEYSSGMMPRSITEQYSDRLNRPVEQGMYYKENFSDPVYNGWGNIHDDYNEKYQSYKYVDLPENFSLKLDRIVLLKNEDCGQINKNLHPAPLYRKTGYTYFDYGWVGTNSWWRKDPFDVRKANINMDQNVLEISDIESLNQTNQSDLTDKADKVIDFTYDYSLGKNLPNASTSSGRLALRSVEFNGRNNSKVLPPYLFNYLKSDTPYNSSNYDVWGNVKENPDAWSLNEIVTPTGAKIKVEYEPDSFINEASILYPAFFSQSFDFAHNNTYPQHSNFYLNGNYLTVKIGTSDHINYAQNLNDVFEIDDEVFFSFTFWQREIANSDYAKRAYGYNSYTVTQVDNVNKTITFKINPNTDLAVHNRAFYGPVYTNIEGSWVSIPVGGPNEVIQFMTINKRLNPLLTAYGLNGKTGGGLRVKSVTTTDGLGVKNATIEYDYRNPKNNRISGVTSYEPFDDSHSEKVYAAEETPAPNVMYEYVTATVKNNTDILNKTTYKFKVLGGLRSREKDLNLGDSFLGDSYKVIYDDSNRVPYYENPAQTTRQMLYDKFTIYDKLSNIGNLLSVQSYNSKNHLLKSVVNKYKDFTDNEIDNGIVQESFKYTLRQDTQQLISGANPYYRLKPFYVFSSLSKVVFPSKLESTTVKQGGYTNTTYYDKYDFLTGNVVETRTVSSDGNSFKTKVIPAYLKYPGVYARLIDKPGMDSKVDDIRNKNMLSQTAAQYSYILDGGTWKETGVGITTWNNEWTYQDIEGNSVTPINGNERIWRKHKNFVWNGVKDSQGIFTNYNNTSSDDGFNWTVGVGSQPSQWKQTSEVTLYDHYSMALEMKDINSNRAATKMGNNDTQITAVGNAKYNELYYSSMENIKNNIWLEPGIKISNAIRDNSKAHTGLYSLKVNNGSQLILDLKANQHKAGRYKLNVWVHKDQESKARINYNGSTYAFNGESYTAGNWVLKIHYIDIPATDLQVNLTSVDATDVYYDDVMLRPIASAISGYVYTEWNELSYIVESSGLATHFEYDKAGRLTRTSVEVLDDGPNVLNGGFKLKTVNNQHYKRPL